MNNPNFFIDALRTIFSWLDSLGYFLLDAVYDIFFTVANANIFQGVTINEFYTRVQLIFGVFMIFKLSITLLQMIINPDMFKDKQKGASSLVTRIAVILVLLTLIVPIEGISNTENSLNEQISSNGILFGFLYEIQNTVIEDQVLTKLVLGYGGDSTDAEPGNMSDVGSHLAATVAQAFIRPTLSSEANDDEITALTEDDGDNSYESNVACNGGEADAYFNGDLTAGTLIDHINDTCDSDNDGEVYVFDYTILGGLLCSIIMVLIILGFTIDVAVRAVKLAILRLIAPIPIISYIDPSQGKDGAFNNWVKTLTSTYLSLFLRLIIIYFGAYLIILLTDSNDNFSIIQSGTSVSTSFFATIFIIIGILMFMKDAPKFFQDMLGIKGDGKLFSGIGTILGAAALTGGLVGSVATGARAGWEENKIAGRPAWMGVGGAITSGLTSGVGGLLTGGKALVTADKKVPSSVMSAMQKRNAMRASHSTALGRLSSGAYGMFTGRTLAEKDKAILEANQAAAKQVKEWKSFTESEAIKKGDYGQIFGVDASGNETDMGRYFRTNGLDNRILGRQFNYAVLKQRIATADTNGNFTYGNDTYNAKNFDENVMGEILKNQNHNYVQDVFNGTKDNPGILSNWELAKKSLADADISYKGSYLDPNDIGKTIGIASSNAQKMQTGLKHIKHIANHNANKSK